MTDDDLRRMVMGERTEIPTLQAGHGSGWSMTDGLWVLDPAGARGRSLQGFEVPDPRERVEYTVSAIMGVATGRLDDER